MSNNISRILYSVTVLAVASAGATGYLLRARWLPLLSQAMPASPSAEAEHGEHAHGGGDRKALVLSESARDNL